MAELVFKCNDGRSIERIEITPERAWGMCYGMILRDMHAKKLDGLGVFGCRVSGDHVMTYIDIGEPQQIHITNDAGVYLVYGESWEDCSDPLGENKLNFVGRLAREYGPMDQRTLERFITCADEDDTPHLHLSVDVTRQRNVRAEECMLHGSDPAEWQYEDAPLAITRSGYASAQVQEVMPCTS